MRITTKEVRDRTMLALSSLLLGAMLGIGACLPALLEDKGVQSVAPCVDIPKAPEPPQKPVEAKHDCMTREEWKQASDQFRKEMKAWKELTAGNEKMSGLAASQVRDGLDNAEWANESYRRQMAVERILKKELGYTIDQFGGFNKIE